MELQQFAKGNHLALLPSLSVIEAKGEDSNAFLNNLLTNRIPDNESALTLAGWANAKGRLLASLRILKGFSPDSYLLVLPAELAASTAKKLSIYVFRSKVTIRDVSGECRAAVLFGDSPEPVLAAAGIDCPPEAGKTARKDGVIAARLPALPAEAPETVPGLQRVLLVGSQDAISGIPATRVDSEAPWLLSECVAGTPCITSATAGLFVPQAIDFDQVGGVSFNKGCYPGQEVIGRLHMRDAKHNVLYWGLSDGDPLAASSDISVGGTAVGRIVQSVACGARVLSLVSAPEGTDAVVAGETPVSLRRIPR